MSLTLSAPATSSSISIGPGSSSTLPPTTTPSTFTTSTTDGGPPITAGPFPPMTTHWSRPLSCTWTYVVDTDLPPGVSDPIAYLDLEPLPGASTLSCYPDGMFFDGRTGVFSPATCPYGWTTVSVSVNTERMKTEDEDEVTTTALCCSSYVEERCDCVVSFALTNHQRILLGGRTLQTSSPHGSGRTHHI